MQVLWFGPLWSPVLETCCLRCTVLSGNPSHTWPHLFIFYSTMRLASLNTHTGKCCKIMLRTKKLGSVGCICFTMVSCIGGFILICVFSTALKILCNHLCVGVCVWARCLVGITVWVSACPSCWCVLSAESTNIFVRRRLAYSYWQCVVHGWHTIPSESYSLSCWSVD